MFIRFYRSDFSFVFFICLLTLNGGLSAQSIYSLQALDQPITLAQGISIFPTCDTTLGIDEVSTQAFQVNFVDSLPYEDACSHWLKLRLAVSQAAIGSYLLHQQNRGGTTIYYLPQADGSYKKAYSGLTVPPEKRTYNYPVYNCVLIQLFTADTITLFIQLDFAPYSGMVGETPQLRLRPFSQEDIVEEENNFAILKITVIILLLFGLYNLFIFFFTKDFAYLYYTLSFLFINPFLIQAAGYTWQWIALESIEQYDLIFAIFSIFSPLSLISYFQFSRLYLRDDSIMPKSDNRVKKNIIAITFLITILIILRMFIDIPYIILNISNVAALYGFSYFVIYAIRLAHRGSKPGLYYLLANLVFLPFIFIYLLQETGNGHYGYLGLIPSTPFTRTSFYIGMILQAVSFSVALAARIMLLKNKIITQQLEVEQAEKKQLLAVKKVIEKKNAELEIKVEERTQSLQEANEELRVSEENLSKLNNTKDHFFAIISHDLRGPVASFQGISKVLQYQIKKNKTDKVEQIMTEIDRSANRLNTLLDNLLQWAQSQLGGINYKSEPISLHTLMTDIESVFAGIATAKHVQTSIEITPQNLIILGDLPSISALIRNLWGNALKFTENGAITFFATIHQEDQVHICISDTGIGIPEEKLRTIFDISTKKSTNGTQGEKGNGLGLTLCKEFVEKNKGSLHIESIEGKGTKVHIYLPLATRHQEFNTTLSL